MRNRRALPIVQERDFLLLARKLGTTIEIECILAPEEKAPYAGEWLFYAVADGERFVLVNQKSREKVFRTHIGLAGMAAILEIAELKTPRQVGLVATGMVAGSAKAVSGEAAD